MTQAGVTDSPGPNTRDVDQEQVAGKLALIWARWGLLITTLQGEHLWLQLAGTDLKLTQGGSLAAQLPVPCLKDPATSLFIWARQSLYHICGILAPSLPALQET